METKVIRIRYKDIDDFYGKWIASISFMIKLSKTEVEIAKQMLHLKLHTIEEESPYYDEGSFMRNEYVEWIRGHIMDGNQDKNTTKVLISRMKDKGFLEKDYTIRKVFVPDFENLYGDKKMIILFSHSKDGSEGDNTRSQ